MNNLYNQGYEVESFIPPGTAPCGSKVFKEKTEEALINVQFQNTGTQTSTYHIFLQVFKDYEYGPELRVGCWGGEVTVDPQAFGTANISFDIPNKQEVTTGTYSIVVAIYPASEVAGDPCTSPPTTTPLSEVTCDAIIEVTEAAITAQITNITVI